VCVDGPVDAKVRPRMPYVVMSGVTRDRPKWTGRRPFRADFVAYLMPDKNPQNRRLGYARVSTVGQTLAMQL
jgi:hypothetical protein